MNSSGFKSGTPGISIGLVRDRVRTTSAKPVGLRVCVPLKITPSILSVRSDLALCSPTTQLMASAMLLLPQPFGPTIAVIPFVEGNVRAIAE